MIETSQTTSSRLRDLSLIARDLLKVIKVVSMYPENNPLPQSMKRSFAERLEVLVAEQGMITVSVERDRLVFEQETIYEDRSKEENLAGMFFEAGITEFSFKEGLEVEEIYKLLDAVKTYLNTPDKSADLVGLIWEAGITRFSVKTLEDIVLSQYDENFNIQEYIASSESDNPNQAMFATDGSEGYESIFEGDGPVDKIEFATLDSDTGQTSRTNQSGKNRTVFYSVIPGKAASETATQAEEIDEISLKSFEAAEAMGFDDIAPTGKPIPNTTLIFNDEFQLSNEEQEEIRRIIGADAEFEPYESTIELLKELLHQETEIQGFGETVTICEKIISEFVRQARLAEAGSLLNYLKDLESKLAPRQQLWAARLKDARIAAGSRDRLRMLSESLNENPQISSTELKRYLECFGWEALGSITDLMGEIYNEFHRKAIIDYLTVHGSQNIDIVARGLYDKRPDVVCNSVSLLARIDDDKAFRYLSRVCNHEDDSVRLTLVTSLKDSPNDEALKILRAAVDDVNAEVRREAVASIVARRGKSAFEAISSVVEDPKFATLEREDQQALLTAYSVLGGEASVSYLSGFITALNPLKSRSLAFLRQAAFEALSQNQSEKCERTLLKLARSLRPDIKNQAREALRRRREFIYGGE